MRQYFDVNWCIFTRCFDSSAAGGMPFCMIQSQTHWGTCYARYSSLLPIATPLFDNNLTVSTFVFIAYFLRVYPSMNECSCPLVTAGLLYFAADLFFRTTSSMVTARNATKLCHIFGSEPHLKMVVQTLVVPPPKTWCQKTANFRMVLRRCGDLSTNIFGRKRGR